jgi:phage-related protein
MLPMSKQQPRKPIKWVGSAKRDLDAMPEGVKDVFGHAIDLSQAGGKHQDAKVMTGFGSAGVLEVVEDDQGDTYRAVYTVKFSGWVYVLHCFQKKSKSGIKTPKKDMELIETRLKAAKLDFDAWQTKQGAR